MPSDRPGGGHLFGSGWDGGMQQEVSDFVSDMRYMHRYLKFNKKYSFFCIKDNYYLYFCVKNYNGYIQIFTVSSQKFAVL